MTSYHEAKWLFARTLRDMLISSNYQEWFSPAEIAKQSGLDIGAAFASRVLNLACKEEELFESVKDEDGDTVFTLSHEGFNWLDEYAVDKSPSIPASDRLVSRSDNLKPINLIKSGLEELSTLVQSTDNEVGDKIGDQREVIAEEISFAKRAVASPRFRLESLIGWLKPVLTYLADKFAGGAIADVAKRLLELLLTLS